MQLAVHDTGTGDRVAVLVHGIQSDHRAWHRVAAELRDDGFRVVAVDLAGHGVSPRSRRYSSGAWADDVVESLEPVVGDRIDLLVGHSLGALVASRVADRIRPRVAVYIDPAFGFPRGLHGIALKAVFVLSPRPRAWTLRRLNPRWGADDVDLELATLAVWDRRTLLGFTRHEHADTAGIPRGAVARRARRAQHADRRPRRGRAARAWDDGGTGSRSGSHRLSRRPRRVHVAAAETGWRVTRRRQPGPRWLSSAAQRIRPTAAPRRLCRAARLRRPGSVRTPSCAAAARCDRLAAGTPSRSPHRRASPRRSHRSRHPSAGG